MSGRADLTSFLLKTGLARPNYREGLAFYDSVEKALTIFNSQINLAHQLGQEHLIRVYNNSGAEIVAGKAVHVTGFEATEFRPTIGLAQSNDEIKAQCIGIATHSIPNDSFGFITQFGLVNNIDTSGLTAGLIFYLSPTTPGALQTAKPASGNFTVIVGICLRSDVALGSVYVNPLIDIGGVTGAVPFSFDTPLFDQPNQFMDTNNAAYESAVQFIFNGTSTLTQPPDSADIVASAGSDGSSSGYRLQDITNALTIAEADPVTTNTTPHIQSLGTISNLPLNAAILELQFKKNSGGATRMSFFRFFKG